jgi:cyclopropane-fatty-acyl-phospholipid synthase
MDAIVFRTLHRLVKKGSLTITTANGVARTFGDGSGLVVRVRFKTAKVQRRVLLDPELRLGEAFVDGDLLIEQGTITQLLELLLSQDHSGAAPITTKMAARRPICRVVPFGDRARPVSTCSVA